MRLAKLVIGVLSLPTFGTSVFAQGLGFDGYSSRSDMLRARDFEDGQLPLMKRGILASWTSPEGNTQLQLSSMDVAVLGGCIATGCAITYIRKASIAPRRVFGS